MLKCSDCGTELPADAKSCLNSETKVAEIQKDVYQVSAEGFVGKVKEIMRDAKVKTIVSRMKRQCTVVYPGYLGSAGAVVTLALPLWLAALVVIAGILTKCTVEVEKSLNA